MLDTRWVSGDNNQQHRGGVPVLRHPAQEVQEDEEDLRQRDGAGVRRSVGFETTCGPHLTCFLYGALCCLDSSVVDLIMLGLECRGTPHPSGSVLRGGGGPVIRLLRGGDGDMLSHLPSTRELLLVAPAI